MAHFPRRPLDAFPVEVKGEPYMVLRDLEGLIEDQVVVDPLSFLILNLAGTVPDTQGLQEEIARYARGARIPTATIEAILAKLDEHLLLESPRAASRRDAISAEFRALAVRPPRFAGNGGYEDKAAALRLQLDAYFTHEKGSGAPDRSRLGEPPRAILAPHIDFHRGGPCYTHAYRALAEARPADVYLILAVAHHSPPSPFVLSTKSYGTPLGEAAIDRPLAEAILKRAGPAILEHEMVHRTEHSAEFQAVFLRHAHPEAPFTAVPILCSSWEELVGDRRPSDTPQVEDLIQAIAEAVRADGRRVTLIGGVDFAHIGPRFGDDLTLDEKALVWMQNEDAKSLKEAIAGDAEGFWTSVMADGNRRHVCGLTATYTLLRLLGGAPGRLTRYDFAPDPAGGMVSFASAVFA